MKNQGRSVHYPYGKPILPIRKAQIVPGIITGMIFFLNVLTLYAQENRLPGFLPGRYQGEQLLTYSPIPGIRVHLNAPSPEQFNPELPVCITIYALPNGSSIEETVGKSANREEEHRFDIQHIGAQTRYIRNRKPGYNLVVAYLENELKSWPAWKAKHGDHAAVVNNIIEQIRKRFAAFEQYTVLNGHSGGGRLIFSYLDHNPRIPDHIKRIAFLDSDYGYESHYKTPLSQWLKRSEENHLLVLAYNDSIALYQGKTFVSPTGGTWYRSKMMQRDLAADFHFESTENDSLIRYYTPDRQIGIILKKNPKREIFHTEQVEFNGFIHSMFFGTPLEEQGYSYFGSRAFSSYIQPEEDILRPGNP